MARNSGITIENNFVRGLITENTALNFPKNACTEAYDCIFDETGRITRRDGFDIELGDEDADSVLEVVLGSTVAGPSTGAFTEYLWRNANVNLLVQQFGTLLYFHNVSSDTSVAINRLASTVDLTTFTSANNDADPGAYLCSYAAGNGVLLVANPQCDPFYVTFDQSTGALAATAVTIEFRDFEGIDVKALDADFVPSYRPVVGDFDGTGNLLEEMISDSVANNRLGQQYLYNLYNQGWDVGPYAAGVPTADHALYEYIVDAAGSTAILGVSSAPSANEFVGFYRSSPTVAFDPARLKTYRQGSTESPKGHFILSLGENDRYAALTEQSELTLDVTQVTTPVIAGNEASNFATRSTAWYNGSYAQPYSQSSVRAQNTAYAGINSTGGKKIHSAYVRGPTDYSMFSYEEDNSYWVEIDRVWYFISAVSRRNTSGTITLCASNSVSDFGNAPGTGTTVTLGSAAMSGTGAIRTIASNDTSTSYNYVWLYMDGAANSDFVAAAEIVFREYATTVEVGGFPDPITFVERPKHVAFFAGRAWYAGADYQGFSNNIYFSQIVLDDNTRYGRCYQRNDPTSEYLPDLLPNDGGVIKIPEMAVCRGLFAMENALIVFATNGVWIIRGSNRDSFTATDYVVRKLTSLGVASELSVVDVAGFPMWWGESGIHRIEYNPQFDSFSVGNLTDETIRTEYVNIPAANKGYARGAFDSDDNIVYWLCHKTRYDENNDPIDISDYRFYTHVLCYNTLSRAFYFWRIPPSHDINIVGISYVVDSVGTSPSKIKYTAYINQGLADTTFYLTYADHFSNQTYTDWANYADYTGVAADEVDYESYFVSGYMPAGEAMKFFQSPYVMVFLEYRNDAGGYLQGRWDYGSTSSSGKWSTTQSIFDPSITTKTIVARRLKVRGKGRSLQLKISSESGKGFIIIGWAMQLMGNTEL